MVKTLKEYMGGYRIGYVDNITPMASLGDIPPKGQGGKDSRGVGLMLTLLHTDLVQLNHS